MAAADDNRCLTFLVKQNLWADEPNLNFNYKNIVVDADNLVTFVYRRCFLSHIKRRKFAKDLHASSVINYTEFTTYINSLLDLFLDKGISIHLVYQGKFIEAPLFNLLPAKFEDNTLRTKHRIRENLVANKLLSTIDENTLNPTNDDTQSERFVDSINRPNLALNIFKSLIRDKVTKDKAKIIGHQAYYHSGPILSKLACTYSCPVLTGDGDFILYDVRHGFMLLTDFWRVNIEETRSRSKNSKENTIKFTPHYHKAFLKQHPGLNSTLSLYIFPLLSSDFELKYAESLIRLGVFKRVYHKKHYEAPDSSVILSQSKTSISTTKNSQRTYHHTEAERLELVCRYLCSADTKWIAMKFTSEAFRTKAAIDKDFRGLWSWYSVAFGFKEQLRNVARGYSVIDRQCVILNYIEWCVANRESSCQFLLDIICCSIGKFNLVTYNTRLQFEDLDLKQSAHSSLDRSKLILMRLLSYSDLDISTTKSASKKNASRVKEQSISESGINGSLTICDREYGKISQRKLTVGELIEDKTNFIESNIQEMCFSRIAYGIVDQKKRLALIRFVLLGNSNNAALSELPKLLKHDLDRLGIKLNHLEELELSTALALFDYQARIVISHESSYVKMDIADKFRDALVCSYLYTLFSDTNNTPSNNSALHNLINEINEKQLAINTMKTTSKTSSLTRQVRHLIELQNTAFEMYFEFNSVLNYPLHRIHLYSYYNPILIYNLSILYLFTNTAIYNYKHLRPLNLNKKG